MKHCYNILSDEIANKGIGGKAKGLVELKINHMPIPKSYCLTDSLYTNVSTQWNLGDAQRKLVDEFSKKQNSQDQLQILCSEQQQKFLEFNFSEHDKKELVDFYHSEIEQWSSFCVRSSANMEDGEVSAFAGCFTSYLNCRGEQVFLEKIKKSLLQTLDYQVIVNCLSHNIDPKKLTMAVVIQEYLPCDEYGVLFTTDPSEQTNDIVLSVADDGEKLMAGEIESRDYNIDRAKYTVGTPEKYVKLINDGLELERKMGVGVDIEWGLINDSYVFFQVRPITTIHKANKNTTYWSRNLAEERYPLPLSPLGWTILRDVFQTNLNTLKYRFGLKAQSPDDVAITINHYVYVNDQFFALSNMRPHWRGILPILGRVLFGLLLTIVFFPFIYACGFLQKRVIKLKDYFLIQIYKFFIFAHAEEIRTKWDKNLYPLIEQYDELSKESLDDKNIEGLLDYKARLELVGDRYMEPDLAIYIIKMACQWMVKRIGAYYRPDLNPEHYLIMVSQGLEKNRTLEMANTLDELIDTLKDSDLEIQNSIHQADLDYLQNYGSKKLKKLFTKFLELNGHLTVNWDFRVPTWEENTRDLFSMLSSLLRSENRKLASKQILKKNNDYKKAVNDLSIEMKKNPLIYRFHNTLLFYLREFMRIDEEHHFYCSRVFKSLRKLYLTLGRILVEKGVLHNNEDIFLLTNDEVNDLCISKNFYTRHYLIQKRQKSFLSSFSTPPPKAYQYGKPIYDKVDTSPYHFKGIGASSGKARGSIKLIRTLDDCSKVDKGDIILLQSPNPVYVPLYAIAGGMISNTGSTLSHGLVAAREYEIPAVIGIANISNILKEGQRVLIDGNTGTITIED